MALGKVRLKVERHTGLASRAFMLAAALAITTTAFCFASHTSATRAASVPSYIAYQTAYGDIGVVQYGHPNCVCLIYKGTYPNGGGSEPSWSPNGLTLAFHVYIVTNTERVNEIALADRSGQIFATYPLEKPQDGAGLDWSPDGREIAYGCEEGKLLDPLPGGESSPYTNMCVLNVVTGASRVIATSRPGVGIGFGVGTTPEVGRLSWSPKGNEIAVDARFPPFNCSSSPAYGPECQLGIAIVDVATGTTTRLGANAVSEPAFSPNGKEIAFVNPGGTYGDNPGKPLNRLPVGVDVMSTAGGDVRRVTPDIDRQTDASPNWSPDGNDIVFTSEMAPADAGNPNLWTISALGGQPKLATVSPSDLTGATWVQPLTTCTVPKLKGQTLVEATRLARLSGCVLGKVTGPAKNRNKLHVVNQNPVANKDVPVGTKVNVQLG